MTARSTWFGGYEVLVTDEAAIAQEGAYGAFVNVIAIAQSAAHFREMAAKSLEEDGYVVLDVENVSPIDLEDSVFPKMSCT